MSATACLVHRFWRWRAAPAARRLGAAMDSPEAAQRAVLERILRTNAGTDFGRTHGFGRIRRAEDFQSAVPPREHGDFQPWIDAAAAGTPDVLTAGKPVAFLPTGGTRSGSKLIPWTAALAGEFHAALDPWVYGFMRSEPAAWTGTAYWSLSPPVWPEQRTAGGIRIGFGCDTDYLPAVLRPLIGRVFAVPSAVAFERDPEIWRLNTLAHLLAAGDLTLVSVWSPTFLIALLEPLATRWDDLLRNLPAHASRRRRRELRDLATPTPAAIWPRLAAISCWTDASARAPSRRLAAIFPQARIHAKGLMATEGVVSIPWPGAAAPVLALHSHFFEFVDDGGHAHPAWRLEEGASYAVLLTTGGGLYRYRLHDRIRVAGRHHRCPLVEFLGREGTTSDLCGEKLTEPFARGCLERTLGASGFALLAPATGEPLRYQLWHTAEVADEPEHLSRTLDVALHQNVHYAHARRIGQLAAPVVTRLAIDDDHAWAVYQSVLAARGRRLGDIKPSALDHQSGWEEEFGPATS